MATSIKPKADAAPAETEAAAVPQELQLELNRIERYYFMGTLYEKGSVYVFERTAGQKMLTLSDPQGLPVFGLAKPRTRLVQIPVETQTVRVRPVESQEIDWSGNPVAPVGKLDLGDDDPEIAAKLAAADGMPEEIDTGAGVPV
jgi:hypothetical protein